MEEGVRVMHQTVSSIRPLHDDERDSHADQITHGVNAIRVEDRVGAVVVLLLMMSDFLLKLIHSWMSIRKDERSHSSE